MDVVRDFRRGAVRLHVLHHAAEREVTGAWMAAELGHHGYQISPGTLYPLLHHLQAGGLLTSQERIEDGHVVRCYRATGEGRTALAEARAALRELAAELLVGSEQDASPVPRRAGKGAPLRLTAELEQLSSAVRTDGGGHRDRRRDAAADILSGLRILLEDGR